MAYRDDLEAAIHKAEAAEDRARVLERELENLRQAAKKKPFWKRWRFVSSKKEWGRKVAKGLGSIFVIGLLVYGVSILIDACVDVVQRDTQALQKYENNRTTAANRCTKLCVEKVDHVVHTKIERVPEYFNYKLEYYRCTCVAQRDMNSRVFNLNLK